MTISNAVEAFFEGHAKSRQMYESVVRQIATIGKATIRVSKSQIAFRRKRNFAAIWRPGKYLTGHVAPLVLTISFSYRNSSPRWKQIAQVAPNRFTHHLELFKTSDVDAQVQRWLQEAWDAA
jgi:hypothetical protein